MFVSTQKKKIQKKVPESSLGTPSITVTFKTLSMDKLITSRVFSLCSIINLSHIYSCNKSCVHKFISKFLVSRITTSKLDQKIPNCRTFMKHISVYRKCCLQHLNSTNLLQWRMFGRIIGFNSEFVANLHKSMSQYLSRAAIS